LLGNRLLGNRRHGRPRRRERNRRAPESHDHEPLEHTHPELPQSSDRFDPACRVCSDLVKGLYAIVDLDFVTQRGLEPLSFAEALLAAHPAALQLRAKSAGARETLALLRALQVRAAAAKVPLFANDRPDLALLAGCAGVHVGQADPSLADVRRLGPGLAIGVSTHDLVQLDRALAERPAYVALGPIFHTSSKRNPEPEVGLSKLEEAAQRARAAGVALLAIGGITLETAPAIAAHADLGAVISALLPAGGLPAVTRAAAALHAALGGQPG
jgi:thiamine-phosphate pyrophosphorylase